MPPFSIKRGADLLLILTFLVVIFASPIKMLFTKEQSWSNEENRYLAQFPPNPTRLADVREYFTGIDQYLQDHFGFRDFYISRYSQELDKRFAIANSQSRVIKGLDGWYFYNDFGMLKDFQGKTPLTSGQIAAWLQEQDSKNDWLASQGIRYLLLVPPDKHSIYPRQLMKYAMAIKGTSRFEQLLQFTGNQLPDYMINLHQLLQPDLYDKPLYYKNDSHWNKLAATIVARSILTRLAVWFPTESFITDFAFTADETGIGGNNGKGGDLARMIMQPNLTETYPQLADFKRCAKSNKLPYKLSSISQSPGRISYIHRCRGKKLRAIVFRDSFFVPVVPLLSENFREVVYLWKGYDQQNIAEIIKHYKPDVVIESVVERHVFDSILPRESPPSTNDPSASKVDQ